MSAQNLPHSSEIHMDCIKNSILYVGYAHGGLAEYSRPAKQKAIAISENKISVNVVFLHLFRFTRLFALRSSDSGYICHRIEETYLVKYKSLAFFAVGIMDVVQPSSVKAAFSRNHTNIP